MGVWGWGGGGETALVNEENAYSQINLITIKWIRRFKFVRLRTKETNEKA